MDKSQFQNNPIHREELRNFLNSDTGQTAFAIARIESQCRPVDRDAPEITSVRAHSEHIGARNILDLFIELITVPKQPKDLPEATYGSGEDTTEPEL